MGLFKKKPPQVIKFTQNLCKADINDNSVLFVRVSDEVQKADAKIEVPFTHNAYVIKGGGDCRFYKSGTYDVFDNKEEIKNWKNGISVEVVYIPRETDVLIRWGTPDKVMYRDHVSKKVVEVGARGQFGIAVANPEQFFRKVVGVRKEFDLKDFSTRFAAAVVDEFASAFLEVIAQEQLTYDQFDANRKKVASKIGAALSEKFISSWGIELVDFIIEDFAVSAEDMAKVESVSEEVVKQQRLKEYLAELERLDDKQWEREKYLRQLEQADKNAYYDVIKVIGTKGAAEASKKAGGNFCPNCGNSYEPSQTFCTNCGKKVGNSETICKKCGEKNPGTAGFCSKCGEKL